MSGDSWLKGNIVTPSVSSEQDICFVFSLSSAGILSRITSIQIFSCRLLSTFVATRLSGLQWMVIAAGLSTLFKVGNIPPDILGDSKSKSTTVLLHKEMHDTHNTSKNIFVIKIIYSHLYDCCFITWHTVNNCPNTNKKQKKKEKKKINWLIQFCTETAKDTNNKKMKYSIMSRSCWFGLSLLCVRVMWWAQSGMLTVKRHHRVSAIVEWNTFAMQM